MGGVERRTCHDEKSDTVDNKEDVCQQVACGSLPPTESHGFVLQLLCAHCHRLLFCSAQSSVTRDEYRSISGFYTSKTERKLGLRPVKRPTIKVVEVRGCALLHPRRWQFADNPTLLCSVGQGTC
jgi:hypothetical protein